MIYTDVRVEVLEASHSNSIKGASWLSDEKTMRMNCFKLKAIFFALVTFNKTKREYIKIT